MGRYNMTAGMLQSMGDKREYTLESSSAELHNTPKSVMS